MPKSKKSLKNFTILFLIICLVTVSAGFALYYKIDSFVKTPSDSNAADIVFSIAPGQSLSLISNNLEKQSIIADSTCFKLYARMKDAGKKLQAGEYILSASKSPAQILDILLKGKVKLYKITIPEGWDIKQIASAFEIRESCSQTRFIELCHDKSFITQLGVKSLSLEGYLFPDTYFFPRKTSCENIIRTMVNRFQQIFTPAMKTRAGELGFNIHEVVTLASIIEKETGDASERPLISSVFHNRLKKNMRLESDPTVIYGIKDFDGNIKRRHLRMLTPYNTYKIKGLPLGPIASPGELSIKAALYPEKSDYLFFVSKKDTTHKFSKTIQEHNRAVRKYQLRKR